MNAQTISIGTVLLIDFVAILLLMVAVTYLRWWAAKCRCEKCSFHVNEYRMAHVRQQELNHDAEHKGWGFKTGDPDVKDCHMERCPRNRRSAVQSDEEV